MAAAVSGSSTELIQVPGDRVTMRAFLARPNGLAGPLPAVLLLHDWWGLTPHVKTVALRFANAGYAALAPDLYTRLGSKTADDPAQASALMAALSSQLILRDLNAATTCLKGQPGIDARRVGAVGFSMGGTFALNAAGHNSDLRAAVAFYGKVPPIETVDYFLCPVLYHYPAKDGWIPKPEIALLSQGFAKYGKPGMVCTYPEAGHGFFNDSRPEAYRADDATLAWERTRQFLDQQMW